MLKPEYREIFTENVKKYGSEGWEEVFNRVVSATWESQPSPSYDFITRLKLTLCPLVRSVLREQSCEHIRQSTYTSLATPRI